MQFDILSFFYKIPFCVFVQSWSTFFNFVSEFEENSGDNLRTLFWLEKSFYQARN